MQQNTRADVHSVQSEEFKPVKSKTRKRKVEDASETQMDTSVSLPKRPTLPPISADKLTVS